jgi:hypothetical protein
VSPKKERDSGYWREVNVTVQKSSGHGEQHRSRWTWGFWSSLLQLQSVTLIKPPNTWSHRWLIFPHKLTFSRQNWQNTTQRMVPCALNHIKQLRSTSCLLSNVHH